MNIKLRHVEKFIDRHGKERIYYRNKTSGLPRISLRGPIGSSEFLEDYQKASSEQPTAVIKARDSKTSLRWLVQEYYTSAKFNEISPGYQRTRKGILDKFCDKFGHRRYAHLEPKHCRKIRDAMLEKPGAANNLMKALRQVYTYAMEYDLHDKNPVRDIEKLKSKNPDGFHTWTEEEIEQFKCAHPIGTKARLAFSMLLHTGQRRSDVVRFGKQHERDGGLKFIQQKTKHELEIPISRELRSVLDESPLGDLTYLVNGKGVPFTSNGFGNWFRKKCDAAGLHHCTAHGLRKSAATALAEHGCTDHEIMAFTGHTSIQEVQRYTKKARQRVLAASAGKRMEGQK